MAGEVSQRLPEVAQRDPVVSVEPTQMAWSLPADPFPQQDVQQDVRVASGNGMVAFAADGRMCAFDERLGSRRWCAGLGGSPAYADGVFAFTNAAGAIVGVSASTGKRLWSMRFGGTYPADERHDGIVWSAGDKFVYAFSSNGFRPGDNYGFLNTAGKRLWSTTMFEGFNRPPLFRPPYLFHTTWGSGSHLHIDLQVFAIDDSRIQFMSLGFAIEMLAIDGPVLFASGDAGSADEAQLTFDVRSISLKNGASFFDYRYAPDYDENYQHNLAVHQQNQAVNIAISDGFVYGNIGWRLYRYRLAPPEGQHPLLVSTDGLFLGQVAGGSAIVARADGIWLVNAGKNDIRARRVLAASSAFSTLVVAGSTMYVGFADGSVNGLRMTDGQATFRATACPQPQLAVTPRMLLAGCRASPSRIMAFER